MKRIVRVESYFSVPTDLAAEFRSWPEFLSGSGYDVDLRSSTGEGVSIRYSEVDDAPRVTIEAGVDGELFDRVLGRALYALAAHSDTVCIHRDAPKA
jgi:hypothetical protein